MCYYYTYPRKDTKTHTHMHTHKTEKKRKNYFQIPVAMVRYPGAAYIWGEELSHPPPGLYYRSAKNTTVGGLTHQS